MKINTTGKWEIVPLKWLSIEIVKSKESEVGPSDAELTGPNDYQWPLKFTLFTFNYHQFTFKYFCFSQLFSFSFLIGHIYFEPVRNLFSKNKISK